jgi:Zn-dependent protease
MSLNLKIGKIAKVPIILGVDWLFFVIGFTLFTLFGSGQSAAFDTLLAILAISAIVLIHECGHMLAAKKFGARTNSITLHCFGGLASINQNDWPKLLSKPRRSLVVWAAGPMTNIIMAAFIFALFHPFGHASPLFGHATLIKYFAYLFQINVVLALFNLLPVWPLDGAGILLSLLSMITTRRRASSIVSITGIIGGACFMALAIYYKAPMLGFIGLFAILASYQMKKSPLYL